MIFDKQILKLKKGKHIDIFTDENGNVVFGLLDANEFKTFSITNENQTRIKQISTQTYDYIFNKYGKEFKIINNKLEITDLE